MEKYFDIKILFWIAGALAFICFLRWLFKSPFSYPYYEVFIDISGRRSVDIYDAIDDYLIEKGISEFQIHEKYIQSWRENCRRKISRRPFKRLRERQFYKCLDTKNMFQFVLSRNQTRYKQINYRKYGYQVKVEDSRFSTDLGWLLRRYDELKEINLECTLSEYQQKDQRRLMTKELRDNIAARDRYTCQICGKYMPDGVGLQIDHIIPIAKGGKSIPSNLQVLCSKCNGRKSKN